MSDQGYALGVFPRVIFLSYRCGAGASADLFEHFSEKQAIF